ncbi:hypothetical protein [Pararhizobium sp. LjRoot238]|uniref:hypothetical protein n=1 Tax=Pararhizobium sp. LjRoot238 TaxID=3342293 RepID=UPI003ECDA5ED
MTTENCVDAALNGLDRQESVTAPSLHDETLFREYEAAFATILQGMFDAKPASRYGLSG